MCNPLACGSLFLGIIYLKTRPAVPANAYQHGKYNAVVAILPVWTLWPDGVLNSGHLSAAGRALV